MKLTIDKTTFDQHIGNCQALIFDWDGVFNDGSKSYGMHSDFSEIDSMAVNLLRYAFWRMKGQLIPCFIITGQQNKTAIEFAIRERFQAVMPGVKYKRKALRYIAKHYGFKEANAMFFFDDVLDFSIAEVVDLGIQISHGFDSPMDAYVAKKEMAVLKSDLAGGQQGLRSVIEYLLTEMNCFEDVIEARSNFIPDYDAYWQTRQSMETEMINLS